MIKSDAITVIFENRDLIAINKPAGLSVHNNEDPSNLLKEMVKLFGEKKFYPVHRLDKETSGLQILALTDKAAKVLAQKFEHRDVKKTYVGVVRGNLKDDAGVWMQSLSDKAEGRKNPRGATKDLVKCETGFRVLERLKYFTKLEFDLITGRQHQIRKHTALNKHALVGDPRYGDQAYNKKISELYKTSRMFLHCQQIEILGEKLMAPLPEDFQKII